MARQRKRPELRPEEQLVAQVLPRVFDGVTVEQHDDGSIDRMYDLLMSGAIEGAVEVGQVTDEETRRASAHWAKNLEHHQTSDLKLTWLFTFSEEFELGAEPRYPRITRPAVADLTAVLARLEAKGIERTGSWYDHAEFVPGGWRLADPDIAALFNLLGVVAQHASSVDLSHHGEPGGWQFAFGYGHTSTDDPDRFAAEIEELLHDKSRVDMRTKLERSGLPVRVGALVFDSMTGAGWATGHLGENGSIPAAPIKLPAEITHALVLGMNELVLLYSDTDGWERFDPPEP